MTGVYDIARFSLLFEFYRYWRDDLSPEKWEVPPRGEYQFAYNMGLFTPVLRLGQSYWSIFSRRGGEVEERPTPGADGKYELPTDAKDTASPKWKLQERGWVQLQIDFGSSTQNTIGVKGKRVFTRNGFITLTIYAEALPAGFVHTEPFDTCANKFRDIMESKSVQTRSVDGKPETESGVSRIITGAMSQQFAGQIDEGSKDLIVSVCVIPFYFDEIK